MRELRVSLVTALVVLLLHYIPKLALFYRYNGIIRPIKNLVYSLAVRLPHLRRELEESKISTRAMLRHTLFKHRENVITELPEEPMTEQAIMERLNSWDKRDRELWAEGKVSGGIYGQEESKIALAASAMRLYMPANPLFPELFPGVRQMESEIVAMCVDLYKGGSSGVGSLTTGGTESILVAMYAYREWARKTKGITNPEIIAPYTVHAAFNKAAGYFDMPLILIPVDPVTFKVDMAAVAEKISGRTAVIVGSAPCFPVGIVDDIAALGKLAIKHNIGLHVDACLGGFVLPFEKIAGYDLPDIDFTVPGVTSVSCDVHKYGCTPKGISCLMWKAAEMRKYQYFVAPEWTGGIYATPTMTGTKNGSISAAAWAVMNSYGRDGYTENAIKIRQAVDVIKEGLAAIPELQLMGDPQVNVVAFTSAQLNVYTIQDHMNAKKWHLVSLQNPSGLHLCVTSANCFRAGEFVRDVEEAVKKEVAEPTADKGGAAALYGMAESVPDKRVVGDMAGLYLDCLFAI